MSSKRRKIVPQKISFDSNFGSEETITENYPHPLTRTLAGAQTVHIPRALINQERRRKGFVCPDPKTRDQANKFTRDHGILSCAPINGPTNSNIQCAPTPFDHYLLQSAEMMKKKPKNLVDWLVGPCPCGQRCVIIASGGISTVYDQHGKFMSSFRYELAKRNENHDPRIATILDCIYNEETRLYFVIDILQHNRICFMSKPAQIRFTWLENNGSAIANISSLSWKMRRRSNFILIRMTEVQPPIFLHYPIWPNDTPQLSGFLFYYKYSYYNCGVTPMVGFLHAFLVPEILGFPINPMHPKPPGFNSAINYIVHYEQTMLANVNKQYNQVSQDLVFADAPENLSINKRHTQATAVMNLPTDVLDTVMEEQTSRVSNEETSITDNDIHQNIVLPQNSTNAQPNQTDLCNQFNVTQCTPTMRGAGRVLPKQNRLPGFKINQNHSLLPSTTRSAQLHSHNESLPSQNILNFSEISELLQLSPHISHDLLLLSNRPGLSVSLTNPLNLSKVSNLSFNRSQRKLDNTDDDLVITRHDPIDISFDHQNSVNQPLPIGRRAKRAVSH